MCYISPTRRAWTWEGGEGEGYLRSGSSRQEGRIQNTHLDGQCLGASLSQTRRVIHLFQSQSKLMFPVTFTVHNIYTTIMHTRSYVFSHFSRSRLSTFSDKLHFQLAGLIVHIDRTHQIHVVPVACEWLRHLCTWVIDGRNSKVAGAPPPKLCIPQWTSPWRHLARYAARGILPVKINFG